MPIYSTTICVYFMNHCGNFNMNFPYYKLFLINKKKI